MSKDAKKPGKLAKGARWTALGVTASPGAYVSLNDIWADNTVEGSHAFIENSEAIAPEFTEIIKNTEVHPIDNAKKKWNTGANLAFDAVRHSTGTHAGLSTKLYHYKAVDFQTKQ